MKYKSKQAQACDIQPGVKEKVWRRDFQRCIICGNMYAAPHCHYIPRSKGGLGIEENIVTLCDTCHREYDQSSRRKELKALIAEYLKSKYPEWDETKLIYRKGTDVNAQ